MLGLALAMGISFLLSGMLDASEQAPAHTRTLHPGDNLIGWVWYPVTPQELFTQVPEAELVYAWDASESQFRFAVPGFDVNLKTIQPGMGLFLRIGGDQPVEWQQPTVANGEWVDLKPGPNLVAWTGPSGTPVDLAVRSIGESLEQVHYWIPEASDFGVYEPSAPSGSMEMPELQRGDALWVFNATETRWLQPSGDRALFPLSPPPDHVRWYASFDKHLDADGIHLIATEDVADEALFRAAAILDDMLVNRPDIREALSNRRVHVVVLGRDEDIFDLTPYKQYRDRIELRRYGPGGPRGVGPNQLTPVLVPEENILCDPNDRYYGYDITVHEYAHAIDFALQHGSQAGKFRNALVNAYRPARADGVWQGTYPVSNTAEYWAAGVQTWFGLSAGFHNQTHNHLDLERHDPQLANLVVDTLADIDLSSTCQPANMRTHGATQNVLVSGSLVDLNGDALPEARLQLQPRLGAMKTIRLSLTPEGRYTTYIPPGDYVLEYTFERCPFYFGASGFGADSRSAGHVSLDAGDRHFDHHLPEGLCQLTSTGVVTDAEGDPIADYLIYAYMSVYPSPSVHIRGIVEPNGEFRLRLSDDRRYTVGIYHGGCAYVFDGAEVTKGNVHRRSIGLWQLTLAPLDLQLPTDDC